MSADDAKAMARWLTREEAKNPGDPVLVKEITNRGPKALRKASTRDAVIDTLAQTYYVVRVSVGKADALVIHPDSARLAGQ